MTVSTEDRVKPQVGMEVYIGHVPGEYEKKVRWRIEEIDRLGNVKMVATHNSKLHRNYPNVNILAGGLFTRDGVQIEGQINKREPLPPISHPKYAPRVRRRVNKLTGYVSVYPPKKD